MRTPRVTKLPDDKAVWLEMALAGLIWEEAVSYDYMKPVNPECLVYMGEIEDDEDTYQRLQWTQPIFRMGIILED